MDNNKSELTQKELVSLYDKDATVFKELEKSFKNKLQLYDYVDVRVKDIWKIGRVVKLGATMLEINFDGYSYSHNEVY